MIVLGLDPGTTQSAVVAFHASRGTVTFSDTMSNELMLEFLAENGRDADKVLVIEQIESMGMAVGKETFETVFYSGRFAQVFRGKWDRVTRRQVKLHLCGSMKAKDANIRQALIDRFGPGKDKAVGFKKAPGPLYGVHGHEMSALAVAVTWCGLQSQVLPADATARVDF